MIRLPASHHDPFRTCSAKMRNYFPAALLDARQGLPGCGRACDTQVERPECSSSIPSKAPPVRLYSFRGEGPMQPVGAMAAATERYQKARITWRRDHAPDLWSIRIRPEQKLLFKPGQYATIGVERDGRVIERPYSIVSSPAEDEIEFFFELVPGGGLTPLLYNLPAGEALLMRRQAKGLFIL